MIAFLRRAACAVAGVLAFAGAAGAGVPAAGLGPLPELSYGPVADARPSLTEDATSVALLGDVDLEVGSKVDLSGRIAPVDLSDAHVFGGLFLSPASAGVPYTDLSGGGNFVGVATPISQTVRLSAALQSVSAGASTFAPDVTAALGRLTGQATRFAQRSSDTLLAGVSWDAAKWASFGVTAVNITERDGILGTAAPGATSSTTALGLTARVRLGGGWSTSATYSEGISQVDLRSGLVPAFGAADTLHTRSYGIAIAKNGLFGKNDALGVAVSQPAFAGDGDFVTMPSAVDASTAFFARNHLLDHIGTARETDVEVGYVTSFLDGSLALQTNAAVQMNYAGQNGQTAVSLLSRARIKF